MRKVKNKICLRVSFWALLVGLPLSLGYAEVASPIFSSMQISLASADIPKSLQKKSASPKISQSLMDLYKVYQTQVGASSQQSKSVDPEDKQSLQTFDGFVTIDAIASIDAITLKTDLEALGLKNAGIFGRLVSGLFPIAEIPKLSNLKSLKFVRAASARTQGAKG